MPRADDRWTVGVLLGCGVTLAIALCLAAAPLIAPFDPAQQDLLHRFAPPGAAHWLGTDQLGRDVLSRLLHGGRISVGVAALSLLASVAAGMLLGVVSARAGGWVDELSMRIVDLLIAIPDIMVALILAAVLGPGLSTLLLALTVVGWTPFARMMRGLTLEIDRREFIRAAEILNGSRRFIVLRHVVPNAMRPLLAVALLRFGHKLVVVGGLSFLGLGVQPPDTDWGAMLADARRSMDRAPWLVVAPGLAIAVTALAVTIAGQGLDRRRGGG